MSWRNTAVLFGVLLLLGGLAYWQSQSGAQDTATPTPGLAAGNFSESVPLLPEVAMEHVARLEIGRAGAGQQVTFLQEEGDWTQTVPTTTHVLSPTVKMPLQSLLDASSRRTLPVDANPLEDYGLAEPQTTIVVAVRRDEVTIRHTFYLGNMTPAEDAYYLQKAGDPRVHIVPSFPIANLLELLPSS